MTADLARAPVVPDILEEHLEELGFLSIQRRRIITSPDITVAGLAAHDERLAAHRDALSIAGTAAGDLAARRLDEAALDWHVAGAGRVWVEEAAPAPEVVAERVAKGGTELVAGWREAFRRTRSAVVDRVFPRAAPEPADPLARAVRADARVWHGRVSEGEVARLAADADPAVRRTVARALARMASSGSGAVRSALERLLGDAEADTRRAALWSLALLDASAGLTAARRIAAGGDSFAIRVIGLLGEGADAPRLRALAADPAALRALGDLGDVAELDFLRERLAAEDPAIAEAAADAVLTICGFPTGTPATWPADPVVARARAEEMRGVLSPDRAWLRGRPRSWNGAGHEESTESRWRTLARATPSADPLRAEVPDGFLAASFTDQAICGE